MTVSANDLLLYAGALLILFLTPGPVWLALAARSVSGGFQAAWPLALGVAVGDMIWPLLAVVGVSWIASEFSNFLNILRIAASLIFVWLGVTTIRRGGKQIEADSRLTRPGRLAGFLAGIAVIIGNPKAILFYMGVLPGFFDLTAIGAPDIVAIVILSLLVPLLGNLVFALSIDRARRFLTSPKAVRRMNLIAGSLLIGVGLIIPFT